ncbi:restriction endonuclease [Candidatus Woesearchaeota archaeon]|nr:restriction endonuclease [Candidatus Woesearchaeota archaeon]
MIKSKGFTILIFWLLLLSVFSYGTEMPMDIRSQKIVGVELTNSWQDYDMDYPYVAFKSTFNNSQTIYLYNIETSSLKKIDELVIDWTSYQETKKELIGLSFPKIKKNKLIYLREYKNKSSDLVIVDSNKNEIIEIIRFPWEIPNIKDFDENNQKYLFNGDILIWLSDGGNTYSNLFNPDEKFIVGRTYPRLQLQGTKMFWKGGECEMYDFAGNSKISIKSGCRSVYGDVALLDNYELYNFREDKIVNTDFKNKDLSGCDNQLILTKDGIWGYKAPYGGGYICYYDLKSKSLIKKIDTVSSNMKFFTADENHSLIAYFQYQKEPTEEQGIYIYTIERMDSEKICQEFNSESDQDTLKMKTLCGLSSSECNCKTTLSNNGQIVDEASTSFSLIDFEKENATKKINTQSNSILDSYNEKLETKKQLIQRQAAAKIVAESEKRRNQTISLVFFIVVATISGILIVKKINATIVERKRNKLDKLLSKIIGEPGLEVIALMNDAENNFIKKNYDLSLINAEEALKKHQLSKKSSKSSKNLVKLEGKWITFSESQKAKGLISFEGKWITKEELEEIKRKRFEKLQISKGLEKYQGKWGSPKQVKEWKEIDVGIQTDFQHLNHFQFERFVSIVFEKMGYQTYVTRKTGDYGIDVVAKKGDEIIAIQVKQNAKGNNVGNVIVQNVLGSMRKFKAEKAIIITTSDFTIQAKEQARDEPIELWNGKYFKTLVRKYLIDSGSEIASKEKDENPDLIYKALTKLKNNGDRDSGFITFEIDKNSWLQCLLSENGLTLYMPYEFRIESILVSFGFSKVNKPYSELTEKEYISDEEESPKMIYAHCRHNVDLCSNITKKIFLNNDKTIKIEYELNG